MILMNWFFLFSLGAEVVRYLKREEKRRKKKEKRKKKKDKKKKPNLIIRFVLKEMF